MRRPNKIYVHHEFLFGTLFVNSLFCFVQGAQLTFGAHKTTFMTGIPMKYVPLVRMGGIGVLLSSVGIVSVVLQPQKFMRSTDDVTRVGFVLGSANGVAGIAMLAGLKQSRAATFSGQRYMGATGIACLALAACQYPWHTVFKNL